MRGCILVLKNKLMFKNLFYIFFLVIFSSFFVLLRFFHLFNTNLENGICYEFRTFNFWFILISAFFLIFSFLYFKLFYKTGSINFYRLQKSKFLGFLSFLVSFIILFGSFKIFSEANSKLAVSFLFVFLFFLTGLLFAASFAVLALCLIGVFNYCKFAFIFVFCSSFIWAVIRLLSLIATDSFLRYANIEYKLGVLCLVSIFLFFYFFGCIALNYNSSGSLCRFLTFGFFAFFVNFANVVPKIFINLYVYFNDLNFSDLFFNRNINLLNFFNFNLVDFSISVFVFSFLLIFMFKNCLCEK